MLNVWSENKYIDILINVLIFLLGINFLHYGQLLLPIICLIIFIDNKFAFRVNNIKTFEILCLFAVFFLVFSYKQGLYCIMGFCLPMAYYIGSNIKTKDKHSIKKVIYILIFSMATHIVINAFYDTVIMHLLRDKMHSTSHYDIWVRDKISSTIIAIDFDLLIASMYSIVRYEKNRLIRVTSIIMFLISLGYCVFMARRTQLYLFIICTVVLFIYDLVKINKRKLNKNEKITIALTLLFLVLFIIFYYFNIFGFKTFMDKPGLFEKIKQKIVDDSRVEIFIETIRLMPKYLFGGNAISSIMNIQVHNLWMDIYDCAGIIPFVLIIIYSILYVKTFIRKIKKQNDNEVFLLFGLFICITIQMLLEPIMSGDSLFLIIAVLIGALYEKEN